MSSPASDSPQPVSLHQIATRAGASISAVSYALRGHPKISAATREKILKAARDLGYRPNPRVASLMAHIRAAKPQKSAEPLAFVWVRTSRSQARGDPFLKKVWAGVQRRALQLGFHVEEFWTDDPGMTHKRLEQILRARGIVGVVLSPVMTAESVMSMDWDWSQFSAAVVGNVTWSPELPHAGHHHFSGMRLALKELAQLGCTRPVALIERHSNDRAKRAWEAAFLTHHSAVKAAPGLVRVVGTSDPDVHAAWLAATKPDAIIVSTPALMALPSVARYCRERPVRKVTLYWSEDLAGEMGGIDQCSDIVAAQAVDLVSNQLHANEFGIPEIAATLLFPGRWVAPPEPKATTAQRPRRS